MPKKRTVKVCGKVYEKTTGMCGCCGSYGNEDLPWFIYKASLCDADGVYYPRLCGDFNGHGGCLEDVATENIRTPTESDDAAELVGELLGDDLDGAQAMMEDFGYAR